ncbi:leucine-rich repeat and fibronectin type-III domain-containing protein 5-like isoform X2 [Agrilus planipennis]|uniref:Leucine-rich repeat and fibronectin type-III domain-containing protein 5-like isoform X2 n=1 Tax=Agrilus planipennis TaxID=224129 RepID=A0A7F5R3Z5_AGRPL|nr:leucine-rich repeat and fibronectin type-III domain-containing protein 5-like isoform X2 [Agrilus planipennis]
MLQRIFIGVLVTIALPSSLAQCPWQREVPELQSSCLCSYNLAHELSVQCDMVEWSKLLSAIHRYAKDNAIDILYVNNSTVNVLKDSIFANIKVHNIQLSRCKIAKVSSDAFKGQENYLKNLNLQDNDLTQVPVDSLRKLRSLVLLDLSHNRITELPAGAFETLNKLATLKLSDNNVTLHPESFRGLEGSLKNLNLKGTLQKEIPEAIRGLTTLAFLDLSQNGLKELPGAAGIHAFEGLNSLTALNLERNLIHTLQENAFFGIRSTLSSLSLLNNLLENFPTDAVKTLIELRVLDIGFNLLTELPIDAFKGNPSLTLLALDGNLLPTIPEEAFVHLNGSLRGLSLGGRFLHCDCRLAWIIDWIQHKDLQVTSRERNPQFCGSPLKFRDRGFYNIKVEELGCSENGAVGEAMPVNEDEISLADPFGPSSTLTPTNITSTTSTSTTTTTTTTTTTKKPDPTTTKAKPSTPIASSTTLEALSSLPSSSTTTASTASPLPTTAKVSNTTTITSVKTSVRTSTSKSTVPAWRQGGNNQNRHSLLMGPPSRKGAVSDTEVKVKNAYRQDSSVIIQWSSDTQNILGFRVVYRLFGDKSFKQGPPLEASEREFKIKNVPSQECIIVCVVSLEDTNVAPETVPYSQCREVRTVLSTSSNMDKITIAASAAICGTIVIAVIIFVAASRQRSKRIQEMHQQKIALKNGLPIAGLPVNCCGGLGPTASPGGPLSSLATLSAFNSPKFTTYTPTKAAWIRTIIITPRRYKIAF